MWARNLLLLATAATIFAAGTAMIVDREPAGALRQSRRDELAPAHHDDDLSASIHGINAALAADWQSQELVPAGRASHLTLARRLSLSLTGTIPSLEEIRQLEALPPEQRLSRWLDHLLADRRYADYMAERIARPLVGVENGPFLLYRRRRFVSWLADELHQNRPYDQIVRQLIDGEGLWTDNPATNFITAAGNPDQDNKPEENVLAARISRAFLGVRLDCAQCHDHPFEPTWKQRDFQSLAAYFGRVQPTLRGIRDVGDPFRATDHRTGREEIIAPGVPFQSELIPAEGSYRSRLAGWITHPENTAFARVTVNRTWALLLGQPLVEPVDDIPLRGPHPAALVTLAEDFAQHGFDLRRLVRLIAASDAFAHESRARDDVPGHEITSAHEAAWAAFPVTRLRPEQVVGALLQAASLTTIDYNSHILVRAVRANRQNEFIERYGDAGALELDAQAGTIPQRLLLMNGNLVDEKTKDDLVANAATRIAVLAPDDATAIETAYLAVLTRRPEPAESAWFTARLAGTKDTARNQQLADLYWTLINSAEFSWNH